MKGFVGSSNRLLSIKNITKVYRTKNQEIVANRNITFDVRKGEIFGILGPNGAGKTTLIKQIATLLLPDEGDILFKGKSILSHPDCFLGKFSFLMEGTRSMYEYLSAGVNLLYFAYLYKIPEKVARKRIDELMEMFGLTEFLEEYVMNYSTGMLKKLNIVRCLLTEPEVVFLDEPLSGLDVIASEEFINLIQSLVRKRNITFLIASHRMDFVEKITDRVIWLKDGEIVKMGETGKIKASVENFEYQVYLKKRRNTVRLLERMGLIYEVMKGGILRCNISLKQKEKLKELLDNEDVISVEKKERDFESVFKEVYG
ncbi:ABC transporter ATP-binding protein [candidate division WOR-3 bacterium]|nr:ABC transporter ATP-binding protein [candidate division WOR-3 bacterium]